MGSGSAPAGFGVVFHSHSAVVKSAGRTSVSNLRLQQNSTRAVTEIPAVPQPRCVPAVPRVAPSLLPGLLITPGLITPVPLIILMLPATPVLITPGLHVTPVLITTGLAVTPVLCVTPVLLIKPGLHVTPVLLITPVLCVTPLLITPVFPITPLFPVTPVLCVTPALHVTPVLLMTLVPVVTPRVCDPSRCVADRDLPCPYLCTNEWENQHSLSTN